MNIHPTFNTLARNIFKKIYRNNTINLEASKKTLEDQLVLYLEHLGYHISKKIFFKDKQRIEDIILRNNQVSETLESPRFKATDRRNKLLIGPVNLGFVFCIDGRIPTIFIGGRFAKHWEVPAAEVTTIKRESDKKLVPVSTELGEALRSLSVSNNELLEIVFAHTSFIGHGCGAMAAKQKMGLIPKGLSLKEANLKIIKEKTIPSLANLYNELRAQNGLEPLKEIAVAALYDTDTFGIILNYDLKDENKSLSTTNITNQFKEQLDDYFIRYNLVFGSFKERFSYLKHLTTFHQNLLKVTEKLGDSKLFPELNELIDTYLKSHFKNLSVNQIRALKFFLLRNIAFQYLTGLSSVTKKNLEHPFAHHQESYMAITMRGGTIGKFDPENQGFASAVADPTQAISYIKTMLSIMSGGKKSSKAYILFISNSINPRDLRDNNVVLQRTIGSNAGLLRSIINDPELGKMISKGEIIPVPVLISEETREVLKIIDHSVYI